MRKILASVIMVMVLCAGAHADLIYTTSSGGMGVVRINGESADLRGIQYTGSSDTLMASYWDGEASRVILVNRTTDTTTSGDTALVFNPSDLSTPLNTEPVVLEGVYNTQVLVGTYTGNSIYAASGALVREFRTDGFSRVRGYTCKADSGDTQAPTVKAITSAKYIVNVLAEYETSGDVLLRFDGQLRDDIEDFTKWQAPSETTAITYTSNSWLAVAHETGVSYLTSTGFSEIVSTDAPVKALCPDKNEGFYFIEQSADGTTYLRHRSEGETLDLLTVSSGTECRLAADTDNGVFGAVIGGKLYVYAMKDDVLMGEYDSSALGGTPRDIAFGNVSGESKSSNSGCSAFGMGMLLLCAVFLRRR